MKKLVSLALVLIMILSLMAFPHAEGTVIEGKESWTVSATSEMTAVERAFDNKLDTFWHSKYTAEDGKVVSKEEAPFYITIVLPQVETISGWRYTPRNPAASGEVLGYELYAASEDSDTVKLINLGAMEADQKVKDLEFGFDVKVKKLVLKVVSGVGGYGVITEFDLLASKGENELTVDAAAENLGTKTYKISEGKEEGRIMTEEYRKYGALIDKNSWTVKASSETTSIKNAFDGVASTFWHSKYTAEGSTVTWKEAPPYEITVEFPETVTISGLTYQPRSSGGGHLTGVEFYADTDLEGDYTLITDIKMPGNTGFKKNEFVANIKVMRVKLRVYEVDGTVGTAAELDFLPVNESLPEKTLEEYPRYEKENKLYKIDSSDFKVEADCPSWAGHDAVMMFDGGGNTFWQTASEHTLPATVTIDMKQPMPVTKIYYTPRQTNDFHGVWFDYAILASNDGVNYDVVYEATDDDKSLDTKVFELSETVVARYWQVDVYEGFAKRAACAELEFYYTYQDMIAAEEASREEYKLKIGDNKIKVTKGGETYEKEMDVAPFIYGQSGTTLIPLRGLLEEMGATISWNGEEERITVSTNGGDIKMRIQDPLVYVDDARYGQVRYTLRVAPKIRDSRTFIPLRFVSEHLGYEVAWNGETQEITISK